MVTWEYCFPIVNLYLLGLGWNGPSDLFFCRVKRPDLLTKWRVKGGVLLIGYSSFRNLSLGKHVKDKNSANEITYALQVTYHVPAIGTVSSSNSKLVSYLLVAMY